MHPQTQEALMSMGYRPMDMERKKWGKPFGYCILIYDDTEKTFAEYFYGANEKVLVWSSAKDVEAPLTVKNIAYFETYHFREMHCDPQTKTWAFLNNTDKANIMTGA